jgi:ATP-dependent HslUV protease ATP-binding subunit HslU
MILTEPQNALIIQYEALLSTEGIKLNFIESAISEIARMAYEANETMENIGARRLHTVMEALLDDISFNASDTEKKAITIDRDYVREKLSEILEDRNLSRYIL